MKIGKVMEASEKYIDAYHYYKRMLPKLDELVESRDALITRIGRMFNVSNLKDFHSFVLRMENN